MRFIKIAIIYKQPFEIWAQEKVYSKLEQCLRLKNMDTAAYFAKHCWNLNSLQKGSKTALRIEIEGNVDFSYTIKFKGSMSKTAELLKFYFGDEKSQYNLKISKQDIDDKFDPTKVREAKIRIEGEDGKKNIEALMLADSRKDIEIIDIFKDDEKITMEELKLLCLPAPRIMTSDIIGNLGNFQEKEIDRNFKAF